MPEVACGLLDQVQQDPAQRHVTRGRRGVERGRGGYDGIAVTGLLGVVRKQKPQPLPLAGQAARLASRACPDMPISVGTKEAT
jgi:hypothetical protein